MDRLLSITAAGIPIALWAFVVLVAIIAVALSFRIIGRPPHHPSA